LGRFCGNSFQITNNCWRQLKWKKAGHGPQKRDVAVPTSWYPAFFQLGL
jgi:hypothetical protein